MRNWALLAISSFLPAGAAAADLQLVPGTTVHFATAEEAATVLGAVDEHALALSPFDRSARKRVAGDVPLEEFLAFAAAQALSWESAEATRLSARLAALGEKLAALGAGLVPRILLVKSTGAEEAGQAYTRGSSIVLKGATLLMADKALDSILLHELFHVVSRNAPALRRELYAIVGFLPSNEIKLPDSLACRKLTNPDAPRIEWRIEVEAGGVAASATPILFSREAAFDPKKSRSFLDVMEFKLLVLEEKDGRWVAALRDGKPWLLDPAATRSFHQKVGANTPYVIHPEEILAENFVLLVNGVKDVPTPQVVEDLRRVIRKRRRL
jgi:hypothetical protein